NRDDKEREPAMTQRDLSLRTIALFLLMTAVVGLCQVSHAAEYRLTSPDGKLVVEVSDEGGLHYRIGIDGQPIIKPSKLGLEFMRGAALGPAATIESVEPS